MDSVKSKKKVAIVGGGVTALAAAWTFSKNPRFDVTLYESSNRLGGTLQTSLHDGFLIEHSADMFVTNPDSAVQLCHEIEFDDQLIEPNQANRFSSIVRRGKPVRTPAGFSLLAPNQLYSVLTSKLLSPWGKLRFLLEYFVQPNPSQDDESLKEFTIRHFGTEVFERIVQPLIAGIYSTDAAKLSIHATLERFVKMEREHGSLIKAARSGGQLTTAEKQSSGARYGMFLTPKHGMGSMVEALVNRIADVDIQINRTVDSIKRNSTDWTLEVFGKNRNFDSIVLATSARVAGQLVSNFDSKLSELLGQINYGSMTVVVIRCSDANFSAGPPQGFGIVVPEIENRKIIACSFSSNKFPGRAPEGSHLMRVFIGNDLSTDRMAGSDLSALVASELKQLIGFQPDQNTHYQTFNWTGCMPQYEVGHLDRIHRIHQQMELAGGIELAGSSYLGVGVPACIQSGVTKANKIMAESRSGA